MDFLRFAITVLASSSVITAIVIKYADFIKARKDRRERFLNDSKFFMSKVSSLSYDSLGDFRKDQIFVSLHGFLSEKTQNMVDNLILGLKNSDENYATAKSDCLNCIQVVKSEIARLEMKWLLK